MRRLVCLVAVCTLVLPLAKAQIRVDPLRGGLGGAAVVGPDFVATPGHLEDRVGNSDGVANPGERIEIWFALENSGAAQARDVRATVETDDPRVDFRHVNHVDPTWDRGDVNMLSIPTPIASDASSGDVVVVLTFVASNGGPWRFVVTFPIVAPSVRFTREDTAIVDPYPAGDGDGIVEPGERVHVTLTLRNKGADAAPTARVAVTVLDPEATVVVGEATHREWPSGETRPTSFVIDVGPDFVAGDLSLFFHVSADVWGPWQFSEVVPVEVPDPDFVLRNTWIYDAAPGGDGDGALDVAETARPRVRLRNIGAGAARDVEVNVTVDHPGVTVGRGRINHGVWRAGEARNNSALSFEVATNATPGDFIATVVVTADGAGPWRFDVPFTVVEPDVSFVLERAWVFDPEPGGNGDRRANRGERFYQRVRVTNAGTDTAYGVSVGVSTEDQDLTVAVGERSYAGWPAGVRRSNGEFILDVAPDAQPHSATLSVTVTTAQGGSWQFALTTPIRYASVDFDIQTAWVFDPQPGGDRDGEAEAGERVLPRLRLRNVGSAEAQNVRVELSSADADIDVRRGESSHATWPAGRARNIADFVLRVDKHAAVRDVELRATIYADNGGPWRLVWTLPIAGPAVDFAFIDAIPHKIEAGDWRSTGIRLKHTGSEPLTDVTVTLLTADTDVTVRTAEANVAAWMPGETVGPLWFPLHVHNLAMPHTAPMVITVSTTDGGLWPFEYSITLKRTLKFKLRTSAIADAAPGGNADGVANPGETVSPTIGLYNVSPARSIGVVVTLSTDDPDITVVDSIEEVDEWRPGRTLTLSGYSFLIADDATAHDVSVQVTVTADHGSPQEYSFTFPIARRQPDFVLRNSWVFDPEPGADHDGQATPGERVFPRARLTNIGVGSGTSVRVELVIADSDITVVNGVVTHDVWPAGETRNNNGFILDIASDASAHGVSAVVVVTADDGGPWQFVIAIPVAEAPAAATALLANFPNPFNPETWIPFDLSEDAETTVHIYDGAGRVVRRLDLGWLPAGAYRRRATAAYWDGRNAVGEAVASGVYMYELRAGNHREMRRMIVRK